MSPSPSPSRPIYLELVPHPVSAHLHEPSGADASGTAVVICPPWGWDEIASYRRIRTWGKHLARAGHPTLRFDYPGTGESGGYPGDEGLLDTWLEAVNGAVAWVHALPGVSRVAVLGLGLGGLLAGTSAARGAPVDDLLLWAAPIRGRSFVRTEKAFSRLQASRYTLGGEPEPSLLPKGWMETGGFVLSSETIAGLAKLNLLDEPFGHLDRALLLDQDGIAVDEALAGHLEESGVTVTSAPGQGWGDMASHPETSRPALEVFALVEDWLSAAMPKGSPDAEGDTVKRGPTPSAGESTKLPIGNATVRESPLRFEQPFGRLAGTLCEPAGSSEPTDASGSARRLCAVFLNAGAVRRIGPNRIWVEAARRWAAAGVPSVRLDLEGIGDSDGDASRYSDVGEFYVPRLTDQACAALSELEARGLGSEFIVVGLCSGSYWGFHAAARGAAISTGILLNPQVLFWDPGLETERAARKVARLLEPAWIREILRGRVSLARMRAVLAAIARQARAGVLRRPGSPEAERSATAQLEATLADMESSGTRLVLAFSGDEPLRTELERDGVLPRAERWPNISFEELPARDHTLRPIVAQRAAHELLDRELRRTATAGAPLSVGPHQ